MGDIHAMLSMLEQNMLNAAVQGNWDIYNSFYTEWEAMNGPNITPQKFAQVFLFNQKGSVLSRLINHSSDYKSKHKIVKHILDKLSQFELYLKTAVQLQPYTLENEDAFPFDPMANRRVYEWARCSNAQELLTHPLVREEMLEDEAIFLAENNKLNAARALIKQANTDRAFNIYNSLARKLIAKYNTVTPEDKRALDDNLSVLIENNEIGLWDVSDLLYPAHTAAPANLANFQADYPKIAKTSAYRAFAAMISLAKETYASDEEHLVALRLLDEYLETAPKTRVKYLATGLLQMLIREWEQLPIPAAIDLPVPTTEQEAIVLSLLNYGAHIPFTPMMPGPFTGVYGLAARNNWGNVLKHETILKDFSNKDYRLQKAVLENLGKFNVHGIAPLAPNAKELAMFETLCPYASKKPLAPRDVYAPPYMEVAFMVSHINTWIGTPHDAESHQRFLTTLGLLLKHGLVENVESIQPGSHMLNFIDVKTGTMYDLYQFIKDNPALNRGFMKEKRDEQLLSLYGLTKAILAKETRGADLMEKVKHREGFLVKPNEGAPFVYNRYGFKDQLNNAPKNVMATIMSWVDSAEELPQGRKAQTADRLINIARDNLATAQPEQAGMPEPTKRLSINK